MTAADPRPDALVAGPGGALVWIHGREPGGAPLVSALDRGLTLGDGLFETMRVEGGTAFRLDAHLARLRAGAERLAIPLPVDLRDSVRAALCVAAARGLGRASARLTVTRGVGAPGLAAPAHPSPTVILAVHPLPAFPARLYEAGVTAIVASGRRNERALSSGLKTLAYVDAVLALAEARAAGADEALFLDTEGHVSEATASNLFACAGDTLLTPPLGCGALPGITRAAVLELAAGAGLRAREATLSLEELAAADEAFLTSSVREIVPLVALRRDAATTPIGPGRPGPATRRVAQAYRALVREECGS